MRVLLRDEQYHEVMLDPITENLAREILENKVRMLGEDYTKAYIDEAEYTVQDLLDSSTYSIVLDGVFAGFIILEDATVEESFTNNVNICCVIHPRFRGLGLISKSVDIACICEDVDIAYWVAHIENISSIKACKGFSICSNQDIHYSDLDESEHIKFVKYYNLY